MRVDHVIPYVGNKSSGTTTCVTELCNGLTSCGIEVQLHALEQIPPDERMFVANGYPWQRFPLHKLGCSSQMQKALCKRVHEIDILHNNSLWMMPNIYPGIAVRNTTCKLVCSPHGTMSKYSMSRSRWKKAVMMHLGQHATLELTSMFHATSESELVDIRRLGWRQPVAVIPNGVHIPRNDDIIESKKSNGRRILLYLSRIHPEKRLDNLLRVWRDLEPQFVDWDLLICGPLVGKYSESMVRLRDDLNLKRAIFKGEVLGTDKVKMYREADLFTLPTNTENFGIVVAEALACGTPAIVSKGAPWNGLKDHQCGWWIDDGVDALRDALSCSMALSREELSAMGMRGRIWMEREYGWHMQAERMICAYEWLLYGGPIPDCIHVD